MTIETEAQNNELVAESFPAAGPLVVSEANPRYFTVAAEGLGVRRAVFLTGSHLWNNDGRYASSMSKAIMMLMPSLFDCADADRMNLIGMTPRGDLTSTGFALANPGGEYLVLQPPEESDSFDVQLKSGTYSVEWQSVATRETKTADDLEVEKDGKVTFTAPFSTGPAVLYLKAG